MLDVLESALEVPEVVSSREPFYSHVSLAENYVFCSDDRTLGLHIKMFGGVLNPVYNLLVMKEVNQPHSVNQTLEAETNYLVPVIVTIGGVNKPGVHSDTTAEAGHHMKTERVEGKVGCGYAELRQAISGLIVDRGDEILKEAKLKLPGLFAGPHSDAQAYDIIEAHQRLADRSSFFTSGRGVILQAIKSGANSMVVDGTHADNAGGIINYVYNTGLEGGEAAAAGKPAYNHDAWASREVFDKVHHLYPYDRTQQDMAVVIDAIGTMKALGVEEIGIRQHGSLAVL